MVFFTSTHPILNKIYWMGIPHLDEGELNNPPLKTGTRLVVS